MAFDEKLADRIRESLVDIPKVEEKFMFGGVCFMVDGKMCIGVVKDEMMCRIDPELDNIVLEKTGCRKMDFTHRPMKGYVYVSDEGMKKKKDFDYWVGLCLEFNAKAKSSKKKKAKNALLLIPLKAHLLVANLAIKGPYDGVFLCSFLGLILITHPEGIFKLDVVYDMPTDETKQEKWKSVIRKIGIILVAMAAIELVRLMYFHVPFSL